MPNPKPRGKFKSKIVDCKPLSLEAPTEEMLNNDRETKFFASNPNRGWLRVDINLCQTKYTVGEIIHDIGVRITEDRNKERDREKAEILKFREETDLGVSEIADKFKVSKHRVRNIIYRHKRVEVEL